MKVTVVGAAGYAGGELLRLLYGHPEVSDVVAVSRSQAGKPVADVHPGVAGLTEARFSSTEPGLAADSSDVIFLALEHGESSRIVADLLGRRALVIDLAADFRVQDPVHYSQYYGEHPAPELLAKFHYGLADVLGDQLRGARAIAVPGCFATAAQLALYPLAKLATQPPAIFAITGSSGAGVHPRPTTHHPARAHNIFAYSVLSHRHDAEIVARWRRWSGKAEQAVRLMAHSGPFVRGIYLTLSARVNPADSGAVEQAFLKAYQGRPFVRLLTRPPELTHAVGTNLALIHAAQAADGDVQVSVAVDNLIKGAGGQAVQAMNLALGLPEHAGLQLGAMFPC
jgi:N-acetyl-gamma-glutamyl-phosphate reductase